MNGLEGRRCLRSVAVVLVKAIVLEAVDIRVAQKSRPSHHQIHILCKSQVSMECYYTLYYMYEPEQLQFSVLTWNEPWENNSNCREAGGRGRRRQLESSYLHCSNVLTKFLELFVLHYLKYVFQVQPQNIKCLMMKVLCFSFLIYSTWDFLGDVHRVLLPINTTDINTELKFGVRIPSLSLSMSSSSSKSLRQHRYNFLANSHLGVVYWVDISIC